LATTIPDPPTADRRGPLLLLFLDGVGLGADDPDRNPFATAELPALAGLLGGRRALVLPGTSPAPPLYALDACLGVPGRPQSGTGQVALLTGVNAAALLGEHQGPYPRGELRPLLARRSVWTHLQAAGRRVVYANAFPGRYLDRSGRGTGRMGAIARSAQLSGVRLRGADELRASRAVSPFLNNEGWNEHLGYSDIPEIDEVAAGRNLAQLALDHDFTLFEHYATDIAGHRADLAGAVAVLERFDRFLVGVLDVWTGVPNAVLALASDHGNIEDMSAGRHTLNPALGLWWGLVPPRPLTSMLDVAPAVLAHLLGN
jgi:hypothetical protein